MKHLLNLLLFTALTSAQVSFGDGPAQRPRPGPPLNRPFPPPGNRPPLDGPPRPPRPFQPGGRPPSPVGFPNRPRPQGPFQGQQGQRPSQGQKPFQGQRPFQGEQGQRPNLGGPGNQNTAGGGKNIICLFTDSSVYQQCIFVFVTLALGKPLFEMCCFHMDIVLNLRTMSC